MSLDVSFLTLTDTPASEHIYMGALGDALTARDVTLVDDWRDADLVHLFEVNAFSRAALRRFRFPRLLRILRSDTPLVVSTDDLYFVGRPELTARPRLYAANHHVQRVLFDAADGVIAISESVRDALAEHLSRRGGISVVHHGVDERYFRDDGGGSGEPHVLHVSLASKRKNPEAVLAACRSLDCRVVLVGSGWSDRVPDTPAYGNVETPGFVPEADLVRTYQRAPIFYFPTLHEGFGLPVLEAMAASCAVVTSDVFSVPEVTGEAAVLHDPTDVEAHVESIRALLADADAREALAERARRRAERFTWDRAAAETVDVYRSVLDA